MQRSSRDKHPTRALSICCHTGAGTLSLTAGPLSGSCLVAKRTLSAKTQTYDTFPCLEQSVPRVLSRKVKFWLGDAVADPKVPVAGSITYKWYPQSTTTSREEKNTPYFHPTDPSTSPFASVFTQMYTSSPNQSSLVSQAGVAKRPQPITWFHDDVESFAPS